MGGFSSISHWLILLVVVVLVFGTSKLKNIGKDVGGAVKDFKDAVKDETAEQTKKVRNATETETVESSKSEDKDKV